jgi:hypothetical protein
MEKSIMRMFLRIFAALCLGGLLVQGVAAGTYHLTDGRTITGDLLSPSEKGYLVKLPDGTYGETISWGKFSQDDLKQFSQDDAKARPLIEPFIEIPESEKLKRTEVAIKPVPRLERPPAGSLLGALGTSAAGVLIILIIYSANLYAAYEISRFRARSPGVVCGISAVLPIIGPAIFLSMPTHLRKMDDAAAAAPDPNLEAAIAADEASSGAVSPGNLPPGARAKATTAAATLPAPKVFTRGQFTFNRRFFETQMPGFFAVVRMEADKDMQLIFKSSRGTHIAQRISRITGNEVYITVVKGQASEDIIIPFVEIQEVQVKHKNL